MNGHQEGCPISHVPMDVASCGCPLVAGPRPMACFSEKPTEPATYEEARWFHEGVLAGLTIYARESGQSCLKSENELLRRLMDEQGWKTIEMFEKLNQSALP